MRFMGGALDRAQSWRQMALHVGHWVLRGYGIWAVERTADGVLVGRVGLWNPEGWLGLEVGWKLARHAWRQGYATEAPRATVDWAWTALDAERLISVIHPENSSSVRVAERLGMKPLRDEALGDDLVVVFWHRPTKHVRSRGIAADPSRWSLPARVRVALALAGTGARPRPSASRSGRRTSTMSCTAPSSPTL
jgi:RimJ/RimL family protein N-acetyltransferase